MFKHQEDQMIKAHEMGNDFAKHRGPQLTEEFFRLSGLLDAEVSDEANEQVRANALKFLIDDYGDIFKQYLALAYSIGMMDGFQNMPTKLYKKPKAKEPSETQLTLPGLVE